jgi:hypothetical protein
MNNQTLIDESVLNGIPDELIRPLLAISIRATELYSTEDFEQLFKDIQKIREAASNAEPQSLYYVHVENAATRRLCALQAAEDWAKQTDPAAHFGGIEISRWSIHVYSGKDVRRLFVSYKPTGLDPLSMEEKIEFVITEASEDEL